MHKYYSAMKPLESNFKIKRSVLCNYKLLKREGRVCLFNISIDCK